LWIASIVELLAKELVDTVLMSSNSIGVVGRVGIFSSLAKELVDKLSCQISFIDFFSL